MSATLSANQHAEESPSLLPEGSWPPWLASVGVHALILLALWFVKFTTEQVMGEDLLVTTEISDVDPSRYEPEKYHFDTVVSNQVGNNATTTTLEPSAGSVASAGTGTGEGGAGRTLGSSDAPPRKFDQTILTVDTPSTDEAVVSMIPGDGGLATKVDVNGTTEHPGGVDGAIDRLTFEIASSLKDSKTLVIWLFDASLSLEKRRSDIADRFENVYKQLGIMNVGTNGALKTAVASYGKSTQILTPKPVENIDDIKEAVRKIPPDKSGVENVFAAVNETTKKWLNFRTSKSDRHNVMVIIVTDERGDDYASLEEGIHTLRRYGIRVYCVGNAAIFGREKGFVRWQYPDGQTDYLPVDQGPETVATERLQLAYWGRNSDIENISACFGPYALTRLCAETGGMYFVSEESDGPKFDPAIMRKYQPDYRPIHEYEQELSKNQAKGGLVRASLAAKADEIPIPQLQFRADTDTALRQQITEAQKPLAVVDYKLTEMQTLLEAGEKDRSRLTTPRWRASYDLAMGRVLALRARAYGYNAILAEMKSQPRPFQDKKNNTWRLTPSTDGEAGQKIDKMIQKAREYLNRVVQEHPGTPWELLAKEELTQPMGWKWRERYVEYPPPPQPNNNPAPPQNMPRRPPQPKPQPRERPLL
ncbi:MAG: vWA domain-containing protein [Planctomycetaceae bacterium]